MHNDRIFVFDFRDAFSSFEITCLSFSSDKIWHSKYTGSATITTTITLASYEHTYECITIMINSITAYVPATIIMINSITAYVWDVWEYESTARRGTRPWEKEQNSIIRMRVLLGGELDNERNSISAHHVWEYYSERNWTVRLDWWDVRKGDRDSSSFGGQDANREAQNGVFRLKMTRKVEGRHQYSR